MGHAGTSLAAPLYLSANNQTINNGASNNYDAVVVANTDDPATLTVSGAGTVLAGTDFYVGADATFDNGLPGPNDGQLFVTTGAAVNTTGTATVGSGAGTQGTVTLDSTSTWTVSGPLRVGQAGQGKLNSAGTLNSGGASIAIAPGGANSSVVLTGGTWTNTGLLRVGEAASASLELAGATLQNSGIAVLGNPAGATGSATLTTASHWTSTELRVGNAGKGTLTATDSGVQTSDAFLGYELTSTGNMATLDNSTWTVSGNLNIGYQGAGTLQAIGSTGTTVTVTGNTVLGTQTGATGSAVVNGNGTRVDTTGLLIVGNIGSGTLAADAATLSAASAIVGNNAGSSGNSVTLKNGASLSLGAGDLYVGNGADGTVTLESGSSVTAGNVYVAWQAGTTGVLNIGAGAGALNAPQISFNGGAGTVNFQHGLAGYTYNGSIAGAGAVNAVTGTTVFTAAHTYTGPTTVAAGATLQIGNGGSTGALDSNVAVQGTLVFNRSNAMTYARALSGSGNAVKQGPGLLTLTANSVTFSGTTSVQAGGLRVGAMAGGPGLLAGPVALAAGTTLSGFGYVGSISGSGSIAPGSSVGTLNVTGAANLGAATYEAEIDPLGNTSDLLTVAGTAILAGGTLQVTSLGGTPVAGQSFTLLTAGAINGQFATVNFAQSYPGLTASVQYTGTAVRVVYAAAPGPGSGVKAVPTLSQWGVIVLSTFLLGAVAWARRSHKGS